MRPGHSLGVALHEAQVPFDDVAVDRQIPVRETVEAEHRSGAAVEALPARIPVVPNAEIERERTEGGAEAAVDVDLGSRAPARQSERKSGKSDLKPGQARKVRAASLPQAAAAFLRLASSRVSTSATVASMTALRRPFCAAIACTSLSA